jgi:hypothetical protein
MKSPASSTTTGMFANSSSVLRAARHAWKLVPQAMKTMRRQRRIESTWSSRPPSRTYGSLPPTGGGTTPPAPPGVGSASAAAAAAAAGAGAGRAARGRSAGRPAPSSAPLNAAASGVNSLAPGLPRPPMRRGSSKPPSARSPDSAAPTLDDSTPSLIAGPPSLSRRLDAAEGVMKFPLKMTSATELRTGSSGLSMTRRPRMVSARVLGCSWISFCMKWSYPPCGGFRVLRGVGMLWVLGFWGVRGGLGPCRRRLNSARTRARTHTCTRARTRTHTTHTQHTHTAPLAFITLSTSASILRPTRVTCGRGAQEGVSAHACPRALHSRASARATTCACPHRPPPRAHLEV